MDKLKSLNVIAVCGHGLGSSMLLKINLEEIFGDLGINANVETCNAGEASGFMSGVDMVITTPELSKIIELREGIPVLTVENFLDKGEVGAKLREFLKKAGWM
ncbi:MAG: PTS sugar transporter subunit IIB [Firmicutes bacterium]|nr:PTS sugar transporter subunit IIB [Bacillota bacterium]